MIRFFDSDVYRNTCGVAEASYFRNLNKSSVLKTLNYYNIASSTILRRGLGRLNARCFKGFIHQLIFRKKALFLLAILLPFSFLIHDTTSAQTQLNRVSVAERSDGLGYVIRLHMSEPVDSFAVAHIEQHNFQLALFNQDINVHRELDISDSGLIRNVEMVQSNGALILDFLLYEERKFSGTTYFDANQRDILLALAYTDEPLAVADPPFFNIPDTGRNESLDVIEQDSESSDSTEIVSNESDFRRNESDALKQDNASENERTALHRISPGDPLEFYLRWIGEDAIRSRENHHLRYSGYSGSAEYTQIGVDHPWSSHPFFSDKNVESHSNITIFNPVLFSSYNSDYPAGGNDGALWQGKGVNNTFSAGAGYMHEFFEVVLRPVFVYSDNRNFDLSPTPPYQGLSRYAMALTYSDIPQRFGEESIYRMDFGESFLKFKYKGWSAGLSNERIRTGPAIYNPLIFGYNAPGFFHTFAGTDKPFDILKGKMDFRVFWGNLKGSDYFYPEQSANNLPDTRLITGFSVNYNPDFLQNVHIGFTRTAVSYLPESGLNFGDLFMAFRRAQEKDVDIDPLDARFSKMALSIRWHFPKAGFEAYAEWGRHENRRLLRDLLLEPELNRGYVLGFLKRFQIGPGRRIILNGEITNLENVAVTAQSRDFNIWYTHPVIKHGFTHRGQVLGAPIGPGSSTQRINTSYYDRFGMVGFSLGRIAHHNDRFFKNLDFYIAAKPRPWIPVRNFQEVEMFGTLHALVFLPGGFELQADARYGIIESRNNQFDVDTTGGVTTRIFFDEPNWNVAITLRYLLSNRNR